MSFSTDIKELICKTGYECPGCRRAELAGFFVFPAKLAPKTMRLSFSVPKARDRILAALENELGIKSSGTLMQEQTVQISKSITDCDVINDCCKRAYMRGAFLASGSVSDPQKMYHLEFSTRSVDEAQFLMKLLEYHEFRPKATRRKDKKLVYIKESSQIADIIGYMTDGRAGLEIMSIQIEKELKSSTQRRVNCDSANLNKQATASARQIAAIKRIKAARKWSAMPEVLKEIGELRLKYPDISIEALGKMTRPEIGKSGVNHRLKRIIEYAGSSERKEDIET